MNSLRKLKIGILGILFLMVSCVPVKQFTELKSKADAYQTSNEQLKEENQKLTVEVNELDGKVLSLQKKYSDLENEYNTLKEDQKNLQDQNEELLKAQKEYESLIGKLKEGSSEEISKLLGELQIMQGNLQDRENLVKAAEEELKTQELKLKESQDLYNQQQAKLVELQTALNKQKEAMESLKGKLNQALRGFYDQGLSVHEKNGKIYVSLEEQLLFKTGSYTVDPKGQEAIKKLSEVLANNPDINIMVEGHTDDVPLTGTGQIKDNWDLSVMRATAVCRILLNNKTIDPKRITTSGRSQYVPLDAAKTAEARKKNRRTEIILTPNLSEVLQLIQSN
jgi:chemotaxis protein MotB